MANFRIHQLELCYREMFGNMIVTYANPQINFMEPRAKLITTVEPIIPLPTTLRRSLSVCDEARIVNPECEKRRASALVDELLVEIYNSMHNGTTDYYSTSGKSQRSVWMEVVDLHEKDVTELLSIIHCLRGHIARTGSVLVRQLKRRDALRRQQQAHCDVITRALSERASEPVDMRFTIQPTSGESGFSQWVAAMKMVAQLPGGIPSEFRRRLWLTMAERHLASQGVDWSDVEKSCFSEWSHPADAELGIQIVKDLHRTGCSLFCGEDGQENQALLKRVLLAYARWNKAVGYCQGFNMLAALILQVTDKCESDALKLMIYLIEGVLPDSYFADSLRGLSVDMAVFRELLRSKLPRLSKHLDLLQNTAKDGSRTYEPPLTNVFTMQWFLTLFCNCLPQPTVLRVWDLIFLEGNEILLRTALAIWQVLAERILEVRTADEFYCIMGVLTRELLEFNLIDANSLIKAIVDVGSLSELKSLRDHYLYNITPWGTSVPQSTDKQINLYPKHTIPLDISALKKQYVKLKQRQRQAHIIFSAAISRHPPPPTPVAMNHLLLGKSALVPSKRLGPPKGSIPPARQAPTSTLHWKDTKQPSSSSSSDTELCDDDVESSSEDEEEHSKSQFEDNLTPSDTNLMKNDNTVSASENSAIKKTLNANSSSQHLPTDNQPSDNLRISPVNLKFTSDSEDENSEFENFLADRVKCLKQSNVSEHSDEDRINYTRRNSERALQIIQENSLILHRIMQCQSRLSPSPPLLFNNASETMESRSETSPDYPISQLFKEDLQTVVNSETQKMQHVHLWIGSQEGIIFKDDERSNLREDKDWEKMKSPEYGTKYRSILEKSKSLDERYHSLILNANSKETKKKYLGGLHESKSECPVGTNNSQPEPMDIRMFDPLFNKSTIKESSILSSTSENIVKDSKSNKLIQENLDLLKTFSIDRTKDKTEIDFSSNKVSKVDEKSDLSKKLIQENVNLLESISTEKVLLGDGNEMIRKQIFSSQIIDKSYLDKIKEDSISIQSYHDYHTNFLKKSHDEIEVNEIKLHESAYHNEEYCELDFGNFRPDEKDSAVGIGYDDVMNDELKSLNTHQDEKIYSDSQTTNTKITENDNQNYKTNLVKLGLHEKDSAISVDFPNENTRNIPTNCDEDLQNFESNLPKLTCQENICEQTLNTSNCLPISIFSPENSYGCDQDITSKKSFKDVRKSLDLDIKRLSPSKEHIDVDSSLQCKIKNASPDNCKILFLEQPTQILNCDDSPNLNKSPSHIFNPFPVTLSSRQNKEVPLKLGLYKK